MSNGVPKMSIEHVRERMQKFNEVGEELNSLMSEVVEGIEQIATTKVVENGLRNIYNDKKMPKKSGELLEKHFETRNSMLTDLFIEVKHMKTLYNLFIAMLIILFLQTAAHDLLETGSLNLGIKTIVAGFGKFTEVTKIWLLMTTSSFTLYIVYGYWAQQRVKMLPKNFLIRIWDYCGLGIFIIYQIAFLILPARAILQAKLPPPSSVAIVMEQIRLMMKTHAFIRSTAPSIMAYKPHTEKKQAMPEFSKFLYFMFAPTMVYRDSYPRTNKIRWSYVAWNLLELGMTVLFVAFIFERFIIPIYKDSGLEPMNFRSFVLITFSTILPGIILFISGFYCLLHAWMNAAAEVLCFGDKLFYKDWWNSSSYDVFYRTWNIVVHDWLYFYIYKDLYENIVPRNKFFASFSVFFASAIFHEYILAISFGFIYPVMFLMFGCLGFLLIFINQSKGTNFGNVFLWFSLCTGSATMVSCYAMEYFARINCPSNETSFWDWMKPRSWYC